MRPSTQSPPAKARYQPRRAWQSPLYRVVLDHLETFLVGEAREPDLRPVPCAEDSLRVFLECGIPRFGMARYLCRRCGTDLFVPLGYLAYCTSLDRAEMTGSVSAGGRPGSS